MRRSSPLGQAGIAGLAFLCRILGVELGNKRKYELRHDEKNNEILNEGTVEMKNEDFSKKTLIEQIYDELFSNIETHNVFDEGTIKTLKQMAAKGELKKPAKVTGAIKVPMENDNETTGT